ncbi:MAG: DUF2069 domain-containing protein [Xanthomonadales bacterium]
MNGWGRLAGAVWLALLGLQVIWHALLPAPHGAGNPYLAAAAVVPLLLPARGILRGSLRSMTWAGYLAMLYLVIGVTEAWANPPQRLPALAQVLLVAAFVGSVLTFSRRDRRS